MAEPKGLSDRLGWTRDWRACGGESRYELDRIVGRGSYGHVAAATRTSDGREVAIKRVTGAFDSRRDALCVLREIRILSALPAHENLVELLDARTPLPADAREAIKYLPG
mmetsp:Transcript_34287/g.105352  ORF Transcript_34287/g.105352 Transcript_34287/m.105352 type:complete len:110 (+) Transcript_34287:307-636(+)